MSGVGAAGARSLAGLRVVAFESRRSEEIGRLIAQQGGIHLPAPAVAEAPVDEPGPILDFARELLTGSIDVAVLLTGAGVTRLATIIEQQHPREVWLGALARTTVVARSTKVVSALRSLGAPAPQIVGREPHTGREVLAAMASLELKGRRVAVQEYGVPSPLLLDGLRERGAQVLSVQVYRWLLPADLGPLRHALSEVAALRADVVVFTSPIQVTHTLQVARAEGLEDALRAALRRMVVAVVGPSTRDVVLGYGLPVDLEPTHPRMGQLLHELAGMARELLAAKGRMG